LISSINALASAAKIVCSLEHISGLLDVASFTSSCQLSHMSWV